MRTAPGRKIVATPRRSRARRRRLAAFAVRTARARATSPRRNGGWRSCCPRTRPSAARLGNAVGLDTPASAIELLEAMRAAGYRRRPRPGRRRRAHGRAAAGFTYEHAQLSAGEVAWATGSLSVDEYTDWFDDSAATTRVEGVEAMWGAAPGEVYVDGGALHFPGIDLGNVLVTIQPPRGFGADPIGTYHAPDMPPPHHYLAFYRWLGTPSGRRWGADAIVHLGKHGTLEWLPGKALALSAACYPDAALGDVPALLPLRRQRPGRGDAGQAARPRRRHRPPAAADDAGRHLRRAGPAGAAARHVRPVSAHGPVEGACLARAGLGPARRRRDPPRPRPRRRTARPATTSTTWCSTSTATCARSRTRRSEAGCTCSARCPTARRSSTRCWPSPGCPRARSRRCGPPWRPSSASRSTMRPAATSIASRPSVGPVSVALATT